MNESQISVRYAKALFRSASEKQLLDRVNSDMDLLEETCRIDSFRYLLIIPSIQPSRKITLIGSIFRNRFDEISMALINLVVRNKREIFLPDIARNFRQLYRKAKGIRTATLVTAQSVNEQALKSIRALIAKAYDSDVELSSRIEKDVIGGFVLTIEDRQYDASVATSLRKIKKQLLQTRIENK